MKLAIVGATGLVGQTFLRVLEDYHVDLRDLTLFASERSAGHVIQLNQRSLVVETLNEHSFDRGFDVVLFSAGADVSKRYAPLAVKHGALVIDNSSAWRMDPKVPLVVPELNLHHVQDHKLIANPNCSTIQAVLPLQALKPFGLKRVIYTTYQAVSGSGQKGLDDLNRNQKGEASQFYPKPIHENVIPWIDVMLENGNTKEEEKMIHETRKILDLPSLPISATCVRVPVRVGHSVAINVELESSFTLAEIYQALHAQSGVKLMEEGIITPIEVAGQDLTYVARVRRDTSCPNGLNLWVVADNVRKGAASNAVQIALALMKEKTHV